MLSLALLFVGVTLAVPIGWFISELRAKDPLRLALGLFAIAATTFFVSSLVGYFTHMSYNQEFGYATKDLIETSVKEEIRGKLRRRQPLASHPLAEEQV
jgi:hypothetical protein